MIDMSMRKYTDISATVPLNEGEDGPWFSSRVYGPLFYRVCVFGGVAMDSCDYYWTYV